MEREKREEGQELAWITRTLRGKERETGGSGEGDWAECMVRWEGN